MNTANTPGSGASPDGGEPPRALPNTALTLGIISLVGGWLLALAGAVVGLAAVIEGSVALSRIRRGRAAGRRQALTGIVTGALGIATTLVINALFLFAGGPPDPTSECARAAPSSSAFATIATVDSDRGFPRNIPTSFG